jgi:cell division protein FtsB
MATRTERQASETHGTRVPVGRRLLNAGIAFLTCALLLNALVGARGVPALLQARRQYRASTQELDKIRADNARLRQAIERLRVDPEAVEEIARRDLGYIRPGETVVIIRDIPPAGPAKP